MSLRKSEKKMDRIFSIFMTIILVMSMLYIVVDKVEATGEKKTFTVGFDAEFPPYGYKDEKSGEYVGFDLDLAEEVCKRNNWKLVKQPIDWDSKDMELSSGSIDCIWNGFTIDGRENDYTWSTPYVDNSQVVVVKEDSDIQKLSDLAGKIVIVQSDSSALSALTSDDATKENKQLAKSFKELQQVGDYNSAFLNLESGMAQAVCMDIGVANYQIESRGNKFRMLDEHISSEKYGVGFKKGNTELRNTVQKTLLEMKKDGNFEKIAKKWNLETSICLNENDSYIDGVDDTANETDRRQFTVGFDAEFPPYGYKDEKSGEYVGFDLDLAEEVCKRNNWKLIKQPIDWDSKDMELSSGSIDCIWNGFTIDGRENDYTWSTPYVDNSQVVVVKNDSDIQKLSDLAGKIVVVQADSSALSALTSDDAKEENKKLAESFKELQQVSDYNSAFLNLESGMVQAICMDIGVANYQIEIRGNKFRMLDEHISSEKYGVGFKKGNVSLRNTVQKTLLEMKADGKFEEIAKKWKLETSVCLSADDKYIDSETQQTTDSSTKSDKLGAGEVLLQLLEGVKATLLIFILTLLFALPLGLLITFARMSKFKVVNMLARIYISVMRGTPLMLQLLVVCYAPYYVFDIQLGQGYRFYAVIIGFSLNYAAYFAEIFRAGIQSVPQGHREAAQILGYSRSQTFRKIIFPQMVKHILPPATNEIITLVKDTSLAFALAYTEVFTLAKQIAASQASIMPLFVAGLFYYVFNILVAFVMERIEKSLSYYR